MQISNSRKILVTGYFGNYKQALVKILHYDYLPKPANVNTR